MDKKIIAGVLLGAAISTAAAQQPKTAQPTVENKSMIRSDPHYATPPNLCSRLQKIIEKLRREGNNKAGLRQAEDVYRDHCRD